MATTTGTTDKGIGLLLVLGAVAVLGAVGMYVGAPEDAAAWSFALAMVAGALAVIAVHLYGE